VQSDHPNLHTSNQLWYNLSFQWHLFPSPCSHPLIIQLQWPRLIVHWTIESPITSCQSTNSSMYLPPQWLPLSFWRRKNFYSPPHYWQIFSQVTPWPFLTLFLPSWSLSQTLTRNGLLLRPLPPPSVCTFRELARLKLRLRRGIMLPVQSFQKNLSVVQASTTVFWGWARPFWLGRGDPQPLIQCSGQPRLMPPPGLFYLYHHLSKPSLGPHATLSLAPLVLLPSMQSPATPFRVPP